MQKRKRVRRAPTVVNTMEPSFLWNKYVERRLQKHEGGCWVWPGSAWGGYGKITVRVNGVKRHAYVHRVAYEANVGPIATGMEIDHLCRNRRCCKPTHLDAVTAKVNTYRGMSPSILIFKTNCCQRGHPKTPENRQVKPSGQSSCRICKLAAQRVWRAKRKQPNQSSGWTVA